MRRSVMTLGAMLCTLSACVPDTSVETTLSRQNAALLPAANMSHPQFRRVVHPSCDPRRVVGIGENNKCPKPTAPWRKNNLFTDALSWGAGHPFCSYWLPDSEPYTMVGLPWLGSVAPGSWLEPDCPVVRALADGDEPDTSAVRAVLEQRYREQIQRLPKLPLPYGPDGEKLTFKDKLIEVAILDSADDSHPSTAIDEPATPAQSEHGRAIAAAISDVTCPLADDPSSGCPVDVRTYQVFDLPDGGETMIEAEQDGTATDYTRRKNTGGYILRLVQRVNDAVASNKLRPESHLVIVLAVGYSGRFSGLTDDVLVTSAGAVDWHPATKALMAALAQASQHGALVVSAIGNRDDGREPWNIPLFPAYLQGVHEPQAVTKGDAPYLYAASAVTSDLAPVPNAIGDLSGTRLESPLAAPGFAVAVPMGNKPTVPILTGSSFGAAGIAATAALLWSYRPAWTPAEVMEGVHKSARDTGRLGLAAYGFENEEVHVTSACSAVKYALDQACLTDVPGACKQVPSCPAPSTPIIDQPAQALFDALLPEHKLAGGSTRMADPWGLIAKSCMLPAGSQLRRATNAAFACPWTSPNDIGAYFYYEEGEEEDARPIPLHTSPEKDPCHPCVQAKVANGNTFKRVLIAKLRPDFAGTLSQPTLRNGSKVLTLNSAWLEAASGGLTSVELPDDFDDEESSLSFTKADDATSITSYVPRVTSQ